MRRVHGLIGTAIGVIGVIAQHVAPPWSHHSTDLDQSSIAQYLLPAPGPETDPLQQLIASQYRLSTVIAGSNTIVASWSGSVTHSDAWGAVVIPGPGRRP